MGAGTCRRMVAVLGCLAIGFTSANWPGAAFGENNPTDEVIVVRYLDEQGGPLHRYDITQHVAYNPDFTGWCAENHLTGQGHKFYHAHTTEAFPFWDDQRNDPRQVTAQMCDWYWDQYYNVHEGPSGWHREQGSTATTLYNCHGYALHSGSLWILHGGETTIRDDDYTHLGNPEKDCVATWDGEFSHSYKVLDVKVTPKPPFDYDLETNVKEKRGPSGIYQWIDQDGTWWSRNLWYRKN